MNKVNWLKVASIFTVIGLVLLTLFSFTGFLRGLPSFRVSMFLKFVISLLTTVSAVYYFSKTNYGVDKYTSEDSIENSK